MYFIDLDKLKIVKSYNFTTFTIEPDLDINMPLKMVRMSLEASMRDFAAKHSGLETCYTIELGGEGAATEEEADTFASVCNMILAVFCKCFMLAEGRKRERRLDVPEKLRGVHCSQSILKELVNHKTTVDIFNIVIKFKDLEFILCDEKENN